MRWSNPSDLRAQVQRRWNRGELLRQIITGEPMFPLRLALKAPTSTEMAERFEAVRTWIAALRGVPHLRIEMREFTHRLLGSNAIPHTAWVDNRDDALALIGKQRDAAIFRSIVDRTHKAQSQLVTWMAKRPLQTLELANEWDRLMDVIAWMQTHPRPGIYLRQVDISGVHSKFIETHRGVLAEMLDMVLAPEAIDVTHSGGSQFDARYGFREKPLRIRFRILDGHLTPLPGIPQPDVALDADSFARLDIPAERVFITENETNFLAFPEVKHGIVVFGAGYGWDALARASWLNECTVHYWGDIDTHGFAILDQLRSRFPRVQSFLMDRETLVHHESLWGEEEDQVLRDLPRLSEQERALFNDLRDNRIRKNLRMEQEMVRFRWIEMAVREYLG